MTKAKRTPRKPRYKITLMVEGTRLATVHQEAQAAFGDDLKLVQKVDLANSRANRLDGIQDDVAQAAQNVEELKDELQEWHDNLPESLQNGDKGQTLQDAIDALEEIKNNIEGVDFSGVEFPAMMG